MARIDRARFDAAAFPITFTVQTRFDDLDMQGHVNNAAAVVFLQEARADFNRTAGIAALAGRLRAMVAAIRVDYAGELHHPGDVTIGTGVLSIGRTSLTLAQIARQGGGSRLYAEAVMVLADAGGPVPIPDALRAAYGRLTI